MPPELVKKADFLNEFAIATVSRDSFGARLLFARWQYFDLSN
jgi:hypothetical protein